jgi:hypothetical protein
VQQVQRNCQKGEKILHPGRKDVELPNGKDVRKKAASKRQQAASPAAPALEGGSPVEDEMAEEQLAVPGSSGVDVGASGSAPSVLAENSAAVVGPAAAEPAAAGPAAASPVVEPAVVWSSASAMEQVVAVEPTRVQLSVPAVECWVINPGIGPKVIVRRISSGPAVEAAEAAAPGERRGGESVPELGLSPAARRAAAETRASPVATTSRPAAPAAAAPGKRKAKAGVAGGSQKRKKSSPVKIKDL